MSKIKISLKGFFAKLDAFTIEEQRYETVAEVNVLPRVGETISIPDHGQAPVTAVVHTPFDDDQDAIIFFSKQ